jgi:hypothetical protein
MKQEEIDAQLSVYDGEIADLRDEIWYAERFCNNEDGSTDILKMELAELIRKRNDLEASVADEEPEMAKAA